MGNNIILETKFVADIRGSFYIPSYQRGYRWSETEVVRLLDDIYQNGKKNYCLQPVVVRKKEDQYELIDGQQRLTTLYLIYKYMNFNVNQIQEEKEKIEFLMQNPDRTDEVFELEDHNMLKGQIGIIGLDNLSLGSRFSSLFTCSWDKIDCALMALGNYGQQERNKWRYQFASKSLQYAWDELFHKSANAGFENTHTILVELLKSKESFDDGILDRIISAFLAQCEKDNLYPWNYYYVKYPVFRPGSYGKMSNDDVVNKPYMFSVMQTKTQWSQNTYMPYLKEADDDHLSRDEMGQYLVYDDVYIVCENNSYGVYRNDDDSLTDTVTISQNEAGIDTEDRIIKLKKYIANMK